MSSPSRYQYARICFFEKFPRNITISENYVEDSELAAFFQGELSKVLAKFDVADDLPLDDYAWHFFDEFHTNGLLKQMNDPLIGDFYWADLKALSTYMVSELNESEIFQRRKLLAADRFYELVFEKIKSSDDDFDAESESLGGEQYDGVPASDRIVTRSDNEKAASATIQLLDQIQSELDSNSNEIGQAFGDDRAIASKEISVLRELVTQAKVRVASTLVFGKRTLGWIAEKAGSAAISELAKRAMKFLIDWFA